MPTQPRDDYRNDNAQPPEAEQPTQQPDPEVGLDDEAFRGTLDRLLGEIDTLPAEERDRLRDVANATRQRHDQLRDTVHKLQETLDFLRLSIKYLVFDVEATRRENAYLRKMLEETGGDD